MGSPAIPGSMWLPEQATKAPFTTWPVAHGEHVLLLQGYSDPHIYNPPLPLFLSPHLHPFFISEALARLT